MRSGGAVGQHVGAASFLSSLAQDFIEDCPIFHSSISFTCKFLSSLAQDFIEEHEKAPPPASAERFLSSLAQDFIEDGERVESGGDDGFDS